MDVGVGLLYSANLRSLAIQEGIRELIRFPYFVAGTPTVRTGWASRSTVTVLAAWQLPCHQIIEIMFLVTIKYYRWTSVTMGNVYISFNMIVRPIQHLYVKILYHFPWQSQNELIYHAPVNTRPHDSLCLETGYSRSLRSLTMWGSHIVCVPVWER